MSFLLTADSNLMLASYRRLTLNLGVFGHEKNGPSQCSGSSVGPCSKEVQNCGDKVVLVEVTLGSGLLQGVKENL